MVKSVDLTPTPTHYREMLRTIIKSSTNRNDREWAKKELKRVKGVRRWGPQKSKR